MPEPAITAAIIGAIATAASQAANELATAVRDAGSSSIGAIITNESHHSYDLKSYKTHHGNYVQAPSVTLPGYFYEFTKFMNAAKVHYGNNPSDSELDEQLQKWQAKDLFQIYAAGTTAKLDGIGGGMGFETSLRLNSNSGGSFHQIALLVRKIPRGSYGIGLGISNYDFYSDAKNDTKGDFIRDHIKDVHTKHCQYSDGSGSISVELDGIKVTASAPGQVNAITISDA
ncbi:hypothetical protein [uncultured Sulfitobacter sp.]|uniref:hypothetical protein n=1 Tax=uncultured Sulfitobacter sp. TaxID=191468 RepID=UPI00261F48E7|nr:hypothetical protein [uncultured Sulfitobacter sp.]